MSLVSASLLSKPGNSRRWKDICEKKYDARRQAHLGRFALLMGRGTGEAEIWPGAPAGFEDCHSQGTSEDAEWKTELSM